VPKSDKSDDSDKLHLQDTRICLLFDPIWSDLQADYGRPGSRHIRPFPTRRWRSASGLQSYTVSAHSTVPDPPVAIRKRITVVHGLGALVTEFLCHVVAFITIIHELFQDGGCEILQI
jgi:hypothetical protein